MNKIGLLLVLCITNAHYPMKAMVQELTSALYYRMENRVEQLLERGAKKVINDIDPNLKKTPLAFAAGLKDKELIDTLILHGADTNQLCSKRLPLHYAVETDDTAVVQLLTDYTICINQQDWNGQTPLHLAAAHGYASHIAYLLTKKALVNIQDCSGKTPLFLTVQNGFIETAKLLLSYGADPYLEDFWGNSPIDIANNSIAQIFHDYQEAFPSAEQLKEIEIFNKVDDAIIEGDITKITALLNSMHDINIISEGYSLLHRAIIYNKPQIVELLLQKGAKPSVLNSYKKTPLYTAVTRNMPEIVQLLLNHQADPNEQDTWQGTTPAHDAACNPKPEAVQILKYLLAHGANVRQKSKDGRLPLHFAAAKGNIDVILFLLKYNALDSRDNRNMTPLDWAICYKKQEVIQILTNVSLMTAIDKENIEEIQELLKKGAPVNFKDDQGKTPLYKAVEKRNPAIAKLLLAYNADINEPNDYDRFSPLHCAVILGCSEITKVLLDHGAQVDPLNHCAMTPLHFAAMAEQTDIIELLLAHGANIESSDKDQQTPLHKATITGCASTLKLLLDRGADINSTDQLGRTPLNWAVRMRLLPLVKVLLERGAQSHILDRENCTAFQIAKAEGLDDMLNVLQTVPK